MEFSPCASTILASDRTLSGRKCALAFTKGLSFSAPRRFIKTARADALLAVWNKQLSWARTVAGFLPTSYLNFPGYLQHLTMESNGSTSRSTYNSRLHTGARLLGEPARRSAFVLSAHPPGDAAHSSHFIAFSTALNPLGRHHPMALPYVLCVGQRPCVRQDSVASRGRGSARLACNLIGIRGKSSV